MPCNSCGTPTREETVRYPQFERLQAEAVICGIFTLLNNTDYDVDYLLDSLDYKQIGVRRKHIEDWWENHQKADAQKKALELLMQQRIARKQEALAKLNEADKEALGIK